MSTPIDEQHDEKLCDPTDHHSRSQEAAQKTIHSITQEFDDDTAMIERGAERQLQARRNHSLSPLRGLGTFGMIGWTIAVPTVAGALLGLWLDEQWPNSFSWSVALILGGITLGSFMAWGWVSREQENDTLSKPPASKTEQVEPQHSDSKHS